MKAVWLNLSGDPSHPGHWEFRDYETDEVIRDIARAEVDVDVAELTAATLYFHTGMIEKVEICLRPRTPPVGGAAPAPTVRAVCQECAGSGLYTSPVSGKRTPCSRGCKP